MIKQLEAFLKAVFSIFIMIAIAGGVITFFIFMAALIIGGKGGEKMAVDAAKVYLPYFIKSASLAVMSGLLLFYISNSHTLSLTAEKGTQQRQN